MYQNKNYYLYVHDNIMYIRIIYAVIIFTLYDLLSQIEVN